MDKMCKYLLPCGKCDRMPALNVKCSQVVKEMAIVGVEDYDAAIWLLRSTLEDIVRSPVGSKENEKKILLAIGALTRERERFFPESRLRDAVAERKPLCGKGEAK